MRKILDTLKRKWAEYLLEIIVITIGILVAFTLNNWNEGRRSKEFELYILKEISTNLKADSVQISEILLSRMEAKNSIMNLMDKHPGEFEERELGRNAANLWTFERFYSIGNGYEMMKSKGLIIEHEKLRSVLSGYYEFEVSKVTTSIEDVENVFMKDFRPMLKNGYIEEIDFGELVKFKNYQDPELHEFILSYISVFKDDHEHSVENIENFKKVNAVLKDMVDQTIGQLEN